MGVEGVSYGGQLSYWLITQTREFKAAIPIAGITNLISYNYLTYYNQYEQMEFGKLPHQDDLMDTMWKRSALKYVAQVATPTLIMHGANDQDVPIAGAEQFYIALKDVGVETEFVMYPREGHGIREVKHQIDSIDRAIAWYRSTSPPRARPCRTSLDQLRGASRPANRSYALTRGDPTIPAPFARGAPLARLARCGCLRADHAKRSPQRWRVLSPGAAPPARVVKPLLIHSHRKEIFSLGYSTDLHHHRECSPDPQPVHTRQARHSRRGAASGKREPGCSTSAAVRARCSAPGRAITASSAPAST